MTTPVLDSLAATDSSLGPVTKAFLTALMLAATGTAALSWAVNRFLTRWAEEESYS